MRVGSRQLAGFLRPQVSPIDVSHPQPATPRKKRPSAPLGLKRGLSGYVPVRNGNSLDYCWQEAVASLIPICDEVVVCNSDSTDGTTAEIAELMLRHPAKVRHVNYPWPEPRGDVWMLLKWLNFARKELRYDMQITLDADEVIHPDAYPEIRRAVAERGSRWFRRLNFWKDAQHEVPDGMICGRYVARMGPTELVMPSDNSEVHPDGEFEIRKRAAYHPKLLIGHYGFLRKPAAFFAKSKVMQAALLNTYDPALKRAEETGVPWYTLSNANIPLEAYMGTHPSQIIPWLKERGYLCE